MKGRWLTSEGESTKEDNRDGRTSLLVRNKFADDDTERKLASSSYAVTSVCSNQGANPRSCGTDDDSD